MYFFRVLFGILTLLVLQACSNGKNLSTSTRTSVPVLDSLERYSFTPSFLEKNCHQALSNVSYLKALDFLQKETIETSRVELCLKLIEANCFTSNQIAGILELFTFESNKLTLAKAAYASCADLANYFVVGRALKLDKNKEDLRKYLEEYK